MGVRGSAGEGEFGNEWEVGEFFWELHSPQHVGRYQEESKERQKTGTDKKGAEGGQ